MNKKLIVLLGGAGAVHLVAGGLFLAGGCAQEDPPMPPGIYVPRQQRTETPQSNNTVTPVTEPVSEPVAEPEKPEKVRPQETKQAEKDNGQGDRVYIVMKNDSLWLIARKNGLLIEELASYNNLPANARLKVGQKIYIPAAGTVAIKGKPAKKDNAQKKGSAPARKKKGGAKAAPAAKTKLPADGIYTVKAGDNFSLIAKRHGLKVSDLLAANPGIDSSRLKVGQKIRLTANAAAIPGKKKAGRKPAAKKKASRSAAPAAAADSSKGVPAEKQKPAPSDGDDLLSKVDDIKTDKAAEASSDEALKTVSSDSSKFAPEKDQIIAEDNGRTTIVVGENTTLDAFCKKYRVSPENVKKLNPDATGKIKAGTRIRLLGAEG